MHPMDGQSGSIRSTGTSRRVGPPLELVAEVLITTSPAVVGSMVLMTCASVQASS
jgi:hypothetical protein